MDQGHLVDHEGGEEESVGYDDAGIQKFTEKTALTGLRDVGLFLEDDLAQGRYEGGKDCGAVTERRCIVSSNSGPTAAISSISRR